MTKQKSHDLEKSLEHRAATRYRLSVPAIVFHEGMQVLSAEIEDFCENGLYLAVRDREIPSYLHQNKTITIQFSIGKGKKSTTYSLDAKIIRLSKDGIGVHLLSSSADIIDILKNLSIQQYSNSEQGLNASVLADKRLTTKLAAELIASKLPVLAEQCLGECYELISNRMASPESNHFANRYFEVLSELKTNKKTLIQEFLNAQARALEHDGNKQDIAKKSNQALHLNDLSLVDESEFEDWLAIQEMSKRIERRHEEVLTILTTQLSQMMSIHDPLYDNVVAPIVLCNSFNESLCALGFDGSMRVVIHPGLEEGLQVYLGQFYQQLSQELVEHGFYPVNKKAGLVRAVRQNALPARSNETDGDIIEGEAETVGIDSGYTQAQQVVPQNPVSELNSLVHVLQSMQSLSSGFVSGSSTIPAQSQPVTNNIEDAKEIIRNLAPATTDNQHAIDILQEQIIQALLQQQGQQQTIDPQQSASLAAATQLFEALNNQANSQLSTQSYLQQLQLPFLHHALTHPEGNDANADVVQHIINLLDQVLNLIGDSNKSWALEAKNNISKLVQRIINESSTRPEVYKDVEAELVGYANKATSDRDKTEKKLIDTCEGQQRVRKAKRLVNLVIEQLLTDTKIPAVVPRLLKIGWKQILVRTELREGFDSKQWQQAIGVIEHLIAWLTDPDQLQTIEEDQIQELLNLVDQQLSEIGLDAGKQKSISSELVALLLGTGTPRQIRPAKLISIKPRQSEAQLDNSEDTKCHWVENLQIGDWIEFVVGKQRREKLKLIWLGSEPWHYVFANQLGVKRFEFSRQQLIKHYKAKLVSKIESPVLPIATRAKHAVVEKYYTDVRNSALEDSRVGLLNSRGLLSYLRETEFDSAATLIFVEIDDYRVISQACGIEASDEVVKEIAKRIQQHSASNAKLARIDDQTLSLVLPDTSVDSFFPMASAWGEALRSEPFKHGSQSFPVILSIGMIGFDRNSLHIDQLVKNVAVACASAKQSGRNHIKVYSEDDQKLLQRAEQLEWAGHIDKTLANNRLVLAYQPIVPVAGYTGIQHGVKGQHYEVLLRVLDAKGRIRPPGSFLSAGEQLRRMPDIDRWVVSNLMIWMENNLELIELIDGLSVNLSGQSVASESFLDFVTEQIYEVNFDPSKITFEITETVAIDNFDHVKKFIQRMNKLGCKFSLDDFGSGYASYSYLRNLDVDYLKIDGLFVKDMHTDSKDLMMVKSMNDIAHSLGLKTIAEFVENKEILSLLNEIGVDYAQGYHVGKPSPIAELVNVYKANQVVPA